MQTDAIGLTALILVLLAWIIFGLTFLLRKKLDVPNVDGAKYAPTSKLGIALQTVSFALIWTYPRPLWWPFPRFRAPALVAA